MPRDASLFSFPDDPDWGGLRRAGVPGLLSLGVFLSDLSAGERWRCAYLATPYHEYDGGPVLAAEMAEEWRSQIEGYGVAVVSPAVMSQRIVDRRGAFNSIATALPRWSTLLAGADLVIVPPMPGWDQSRDVWCAARAALEAQTPVFVLGVVP